MTKDEMLKQEAEEYIKWHPTEGTKDFVVYKVRVGENAFNYVVEHKNELYCSDWIKMYEGTEQECYRVVGYLDSAESKEKSIAELKEWKDEWHVDCDRAEKHGELCLGYSGDEDEPCERCKNCIKCECGYYQLGETKKDDQLAKVKAALRNVIDYLGQFCSDYPDCVIEAEGILKEE